MGLSLGRRACGTCIGFRSWLSPLSVLLACSIFSGPLEELAAMALEPVARQAENISSSKQAATKVQLRLVAMAVAWVEGR